MLHNPRLSGAEILSAAGEPHNCDGENSRNRWWSKKKIIPLRRLLDSGLSESYNNTALVDGQNREGNLFIKVCMTGTNPGDENPGEKGVPRFILYSEIWKISKREG